MAAIRRLYGKRRRIVRCIDYLDARDGVLRLADAAQRTAHLMWLRRGLV